MTRLTGLEKSLLHVMLTIVCVAQACACGSHGGIEHPSDQALIPELQLIKEEETVSIASRGGHLRLQYVERHAQRTLGGYDRQPGHGMDYGEILT